MEGGAPAPRDGSSSGTGLGLALVCRICEYLGASFEVRARAGGGTAFDIHFGKNLTRP
jgi:signal transduction histidine kinase